MGMDNIPFFSRRTRVKDVTLFSFPVIRDHRGNLAFIQWNDAPFAFKRVYYIYDIPAGARRGGHAHIAQKEILIALSGSFDVILHDGKERKTVHLNNPAEGLYIPPGIWREIDNFSANSVCLVLNSDIFDEKDYIREFENFLEFKKLS